MFTIFVNTVHFTYSTTKAPFVLTSNWFRKCFSGKVDVWLLLKIWSNWKWFQFDRKIRLRGQKIISVLIFTSNHFRPRKRDRTNTPAPTKARSIHIQELRQTQKTQDQARSSSNAQREREREREREKEGLRRANTERERERERSRRRTHSSDREPRNRHQSSNPEIVTDRRTQKSSILSLIRLLSLISDFLVVVVVSWVALVLLFFDFGLIFDLMIFFFVGHWEFGFEFGFCWMWWYICLEAEKMWETS